MILRHALAILMLPIMGLAVVPWIILSYWPPAARVAANPIRMVVGAVGMAALVAGLALMCSAIRQFVKLGHGTLAPWDPPGKLVVAGIFRYVRNPIITGVVLVLLGETLVFQSIDLAAWWAIVLAANAVYIPLVEERGLARRFGDDYLEYKKNVPRWIPRLSPWEPKPGRTGRNDRPK